MACQRVFNSYLTVKCGHDDINTTQNDRKRKKGADGHEITNHSISVSKKVEQHQCSTAKLSIFSSWPSGYLIHITHIFCLSQWPNP